MNILVCVKQVPDTTEIKIDPETNTLVRAGVPSIVNTFDAYALEMAVRLKEAVGGKVTILTMGPEQAKAAIKECLSVGADEGYLVSGRAFAGSDTLATSYVLSCAIEKLQEMKGEKFDLIFCGKQAIDGDTGQVGPEMAEHFDIPQITYVSDVIAEGDEIKFKRENDMGYDLIETEMPAVITVVKTKYEPRYPSIKSKMMANKAEIPVLTDESFPFEATKCGLKGSPTRVKKTYTPVREKSGIVIKEETSGESVQKLLGLLTDAKIM